MFEIDEVELKRLDPRIRKVCAWLAEEGFLIVGGSEIGRDDNLGIIIAVDAADMVYESDRLFKVLAHQGVVLTPPEEGFYTLDDISQMSHPAIISFYDPGIADTNGFINLLNVTDMDVFGGLSVVQ